MKNFFWGQVKKFVKWDYFSFVFLALGLLAIHSGAYLMRDDSNGFSKILTDDNYLKTMIMYMSDRYKTGTSRLIIEFILVFMVKYFNVWKILDTIVFFMLGISTMKLLNFKNKYVTNFIISALILSIPIGMFASAGFVATTLNYIWPLSFGIFSLIPIRKIIDNKPFRRFEFPLYSVALIIAANMEQMCAVLLVAYLCFTVYLYIKRHKIYTYMIIQTLLVLISVIFILTCPGNKGRAANEMYYLPEFVNLSLINKLELGFSSTFFYFIMHSSIIMCIVFLFDRYLYSRTSKKASLYCSLVFISAFFGYFSSAYYGILS